MSPSVSQLYGQRAISEAQLRRLFAIVHGTREQPPRLGGNKRDRVNQLWQIVQRYGYTDWDCVDSDGNPSRWISVADYEQIVAELQAMRGGL